MIVSSPNNALNIRNSISPSSISISNHNVSPNSISPNSKSNPKSVISERDERHSSPSHKYSKPEIVIRKLKKVVLPTKVITYKHRPRTKLTKTALHYHNIKQNLNNGNNEHKDQTSYDDKHYEQNDNDNDNDISHSTNDVADVDNSKIISENNKLEDASSNTFNKSKLIALKKKIQNSPAKNVALNDHNTIKFNDNEAITSDSSTNVVLTSDSLTKDEDIDDIVSNEVDDVVSNGADDIVSNGARVSDDSSEEGDNDANNGLSSHLDDIHNFSESLERSYIEELPEHKVYHPSLSYDNVENDDIKPDQNGSDADNVQEEIAYPVKLTDSNESSLLKEQADELEEERKVRATLEARLQESRIMLQILAGQNLRTYQRRKSHNDIDVLEKTVEGVGEVLSVPVDTVVSPANKVIAEGQKPSSASRKENSNTPPKVITSIRRANNNSTPVISISLSHLIDDLADSSPQIDTESNESSRKTVNNATDSPTASENKEESGSVISEKVKTGSIFNSLLSVFQRKKGDESKRADSGRLDKGSSKFEESKKDEVDETESSNKIDKNEVDVIDDNAVSPHSTDINFGNDGVATVDEEYITNNLPVAADEDHDNEYTDETPELHSKTPAGKIAGNLHVDTGQFLSPIERNLSLALTPGITPSQFRDISLDDLGITLDNSSKSFKTSDLLQLLALDPIVLRKALLLGKSLPEILNMIKINDEINAPQDDRKLYDDDISKPSKVESYYLPFYITLKSQELRRYPFQLRIPHEDITLFTLFQLYGKMEGGLFVTHIRLSSITKALQDVKIIGASLLSDKKIEALLRKIPYTSNKQAVNSIDGSTFISPTTSKANPHKKVMAINSSALLSPQFSKQYSFDQFKHILSAIIPIIIKTAVHHDENADVDAYIFETIKLSIKLWLLSSSTISNATYKQSLDNSKVCLSGMIKCIGSPLTPTAIGAKSSATNSISPKRKSITIDTSGIEHDITLLWGCSVSLEQIKSTKLLWDKNMEQLKSVFIGYGTRAVGQRSGSPTNHTATAANNNISTYLSFDECREMLIDFGIIPDILDQQTFTKIFRSCKLWEWYIAASIGNRRSNQDDSTSTTLGDDSKTSPRRKSPQNFNDFLLQEQQHHTVGSQHQQLHHYLPNLTNYSDADDIISSVGSFHLTFVGLVELLTRIACYGGRLGSTPRGAVENLLRIMNSSNGKYKLVNSRKKKVTCTRNFSI